jgi:hypothetical protein
LEEKNYSSATDTKSRFLAGTFVNWLAQMPKAKLKTAVLKGWEDIAQFLGQPRSTAQRWTREGMPVERKGRMVEAQPEKLNSWLGRVSHEPVHIATEASDLSSELRRGLAYVRGSRSRWSKRK